MLDKVIHRHLDKMDELEAELDNDIDSIFKNIDIDAVIADPQGALQTVADTIAEILTDDYLSRAARLGIDFSKAIKKDGDVVVQDSNDPKLNQEELVGSDKDRD